MGKFKIIDESGDKKYFTIIPNYILNHSTAVAQALYLQLKRLAGGTGVAYPGQRYLMERLNISQPTLRKELKYLLDKNWIRKLDKKDVMTTGGKQKIQSYEIVDLWDLNNQYYTSQRGEKIATPLPKGCKNSNKGVKNQQQRGEKIATKEETYKKKYIRRKQNKFYPPSLDQVNEYIEQMDWEVNGEQWHAYYEANGWKVGQNKMKDWKSAIKTWQYRNKPKMNEYEKALKVLKPLKYKSKYYTNKFFKWNGINLFAVKDELTMFYPEQQELLSKNVRIVIENLDEINKMICMT
jgi:hypothetical protein